MLEAIDGQRYAVLTKNGKGTNFWGKHQIMTISLWREKLFPILVALVTVFLWQWAGQPFPQNTDGLLGTAATVASVLAGFMGVSQSIILTIKDTPMFKKIIEHEYDNELFSYLKSGIYSSSIFAAISMVGFFITPATTIFSYKLDHPYQTVWIFTAAFSFSSFMRMTKILFKMLKQTIA